MIYIIFTMATIINIFNILLIANNKIYQNIKEKTLLLTYSIAELIYIIFILSLIEYTAASTVFAISFISVWLLGKAYICVINMNFNDNGDVVISMDNKNEQYINEMNGNQESIENRLEDRIEANGSVFKVPENNIEEVEIIHEVPEDSIEENKNVEEKIELSDLFESSQENNEHLVPLNELSDIVESARISKEEERRIRRRSVALRASKIINNEK